MSLSQSHTMIAARPRIPISRRAVAGLSLAFVLLALGELITHSGALTGAIVLLAAAVSSIAGFAFSPLAGALLFHVSRDVVETIQIMLVASIALQAYSVWTLRRSIGTEGLWPYIVGGLATVPLGVYLLLHTSIWLHTFALGTFLCFYGSYMLLRPPWRLGANYVAGQIAVGALGGITGATAAFPGAFVTIWCGWHGWDKDRQRGIYQPYILVMQLAVLAWLGATRPYAMFRPQLLMYALPSLLGAWCGLHLYRRLAPSQFDRWVCMMLLISGILLVLKTR